MPRGLSKQAQEFHDWLYANDYGRLGGRTQAGHLKYQLRNGTFYISGSTPSDFRFFDNAKAEVRRMLGVKNDSPNAGKYSHKKTDGFDGRVTMADRHPPEVHRLIKKVGYIDAEITSMQSRQDVFRLRKLARQRVELSTELAEFGVVIPPPRKAS